MERTLRKNATGIEDVMVMIGTVHDETMKGATCTIVSTVVSIESILVTGIAVVIATDQYDDIVRGNAMSTRDTAAIPGTEIRA